MVIEIRYPPPDGIVLLTGITTLEEVTSERGKLKAAID